MLSSSLCERRRLQKNSFKKDMMQMESRSTMTELMCSRRTATNGSEMYSSVKWLPELLPALQMARVIVTHTRYVHQYLGQVSHWEVQAVFVVQRQKDPQVIPNLVSIGDSNTNAVNNRVENSSAVWSPVLLPALYKLLLPVTVK